MTQDNSVEKQVEELAKVLYWQQIQEFDDTAIPFDALDNDNKKLYLRDAKYLIDNGWRKVQ